MNQRFRDRSHAGRQLAALLEAYAQREDVRVLALPRGGVPVAFEVAQALHVPLGLFLVRKLGVPGQEELAAGAIASGGVRVINEDVVDALQIPAAVLDAITQRESAEIERQERAYGAHVARVDLRGRMILLIDDGVATGSTVLAALRALRQRAPARVVLAVPVAAHSVAERLRQEFDEVVCVSEPAGLDGVSAWYDDFRQTSDEEVRRLILAAARPAPPARDDAATTHESIEIDAGGIRLEGDLAMPPGAAAIILFAHGSGSSRKSPRNRAVAQVLQDAGFATLLFDLLTEREDVTDAAGRSARFDIPRLADRLVAAIDHVGHTPQTAGLAVGLFGASTGAAAALIAAGRRAIVQAVVSRGGRPDLAGDALEDVHCPVLLIVGERDHTVLELNRTALDRIPSDRRLDIVPGATHLFEEPGTLERAAHAALDWFRRFLPAGP